MALKLPRSIKRLEDVKRGRRRVGAICQTKSGRSIFLMELGRKEISRDGKSFISDAVRDESAAWMIDEYLAIRLRAKKVEFLGIILRDTRCLFLTKADFLFDRERMKIVRFGVNTKRTLPFRFFAHRQGKSTL